MDLNELINLVRNFIFYHPYIAMGIAAALGILVYIKPKEVLKLILIFLGFCIVGYVLYYIWGATKSGVFQKDTLIHKSL